MLPHSATALQPAVQQVVPTLLHAACPAPAATPTRPETRQRCTPALNRPLAASHPAAPTRTRCPQVLRPVAVCLLNRLRSIATARLSVPPPQPQPARPLSTRNRRRRQGQGTGMEDGLLSPKSPTARRAEDVMASGACACC